MIGKKNCFIFIYSILICSQILTAQNVETNKKMIKNAIINNDWFESFCLINETLNSFPEERKDIIKDYLDVCQNYQSFANINKLLCNITDIENTSGLTINEVVFTGGSGCYVRNQLNIDIQISDVVSIRANNKSIVTSIENYKDYLNIYKLLIKNCQKDKYGISLSTADLLGVIKIKYTDNGSKKEKEYSIEYGFVNDKNMYLAIYALLSSADIM
jgi:hypothetical protein